MATNSKMRRLWILGAGGALGAAALLSQPRSVEALCADSMVVVGNAVYDSETFLAWERAPSKTKFPAALGAGTATKTAAEHCAETLIDGRAGRLPTIYELLSILDTTTKAPAVDPIFHNLTVVPPVETPNGEYWTSTPDASSPSDRLWYVDFATGATARSGLRQDRYVRCVRNR